MKRTKALKSRPSSSSAETSPQLPIGCRIGTIALISLISIYYFWILIPCRLLPQNHYYNMLADAFESGSLSLLVKPTKELLALKDPYDPAQNGPYRLHDASLYKGTYYLYYGPVPAVILFVPLEILLHVRFDQSIAVALFLAAGLLSGALLLRFFLNQTRIPIPHWMFFAGILTLGLSNASPFLLMRPDVYEVAIACGYFLGMTGLYLVLTGICDSNIVRFRIAIGSLCCGLAVGARPTYVVFALFFPMAAVALINRSIRPRVSRESLSTVLLLCLPFGTCGLILMAYNYARFGNPFELGIHYQLAAINPKEYLLFRPDLFLNRISGYLFFNYTVDCMFPFIHVPRGTIFGEPEAGTFLMNPLLWMLIPWTVSLCFGSFGRDRKHARSIILILLGFGSAVVLLLCIIAHPLIRYHVDYEGFLLAGALFAWWDLSHRYAGQPKVQKAIRIGGAGLIAYSCWVGVAFGWNDVSPTAIRRFYDGNNLAARGDATQAVEEYREATRISPDFALAENALAQVLAAQGRGMESAAHFSAAMRQFIATNVAYKDRGYMPAFQGLCITDPFNEYLRLAQILLQHRQIDEALLALDGLVKAFCEAGFCDQAINGADAIAKMAASSNQGEFASRIGDRVRQYRTSGSPSK